MRVSLFTRDDCELCQQVKADLASLKEELPHKLHEVDIDNDPELYERYHDIIPVCIIGPYTLQAPIRKIDLEVALRAAEESTGKQDQASPKKSKNQGVRLNKGLLFFARHWLAIFNLIVFVFVTLPFGAPVLMRAGLETPAKVIYRIYSPLCHQLSFRSWFLFGEQAYYPLEQAGLEVESYEQITGVATSDWMQAREFTGNERMGYKVAFCQRDVAIYAGILLAGFLFSLVRKRLRPLPIWVWFFLGIVPIALDGGTQLISNLPLLNFPVRETIPAFRTITGAMFGMVNVWLAYPVVEETMDETRILVLSKLATAGEIV